MKPKSPPAQMNQSKEGPEPPVLAGVRRRRSFEEKYMIVEETLAPGASVAAVARRHGVNANQVFAWRRECRKGIPEHVRARHGMPPQDFIQIGVLEDISVKPVVPTSLPVCKGSAPSLSAVASCWLVEVELRNGVKVRIGAGIDERDMRRALLLARELA